MYLLAADLEILHQLDELAGNGGGIVRYLKALDELTDLFEHCGLGQVLEGLRPGHGNQVFSDDLTTDPDCPASLVNGVDRRQRLFMKRCFDNVGVDQNVGIDEQRLLVHHRHTYPRGVSSNPRATGPH